MRHHTRGERLITLLDTSHDLATCADEIGGDVGQLLTPLTRYRLREPERPWAIDNGAYSRFDEKAFVALLAREYHHRQNAKFVCAPDVVGSAQRTLEVFDIWKGRLQAWPIAFVCQDGQENLPIPWRSIEAVFIGGSTTWKLSEHAKRICQVAKLHFNKWVHVGRVNDPARFAGLEGWGCVDSVDGSGLARYSHMREAVANRNEQERLFEHV